jgi:hypothetical protein
MSVQIFISTVDITPESRNTSLLGNDGKHVPAEMYTHATREEPDSKQRIGKHINGGVVGNDVFSSVPVK